VWVPGADTVLRAMELAANHTLSTWDAMIVQAAVESGCDTLFTEDLQAGRRFDSVEVVNPFDQKAHEPAPRTTKPRSRNR
jgi:predicted nucleic acid-binding protein